MKIFGIFGDPIEHSLSPVMQNAAFRSMGLDACYHAFRVSKENLFDAVIGAGAMGFGGLNLTIPLKEKALSMPEICLDGLARDIGAINTISFERDEPKEKEAFSEKIRVHGHNTDAKGALMALKQAGARIRGSSVLIIGAGGAARAIAYALGKDGADLSIANRSPERAVSLAKSIGAATGASVRGFGLERLRDLVPASDIVINSTSVGMREGDGRVLDAGLITSDQIIFDIVYNRRTELLRNAAAAGAIAIDGVMMLVFQGARAIEIWTGREAPVDVMEQAVRDALEARARGHGKA